MGVVPSSSCEWVGSGWNVRSVCMWCVLGGELIMMVSQFLTCVHIRKLQFYTCIRCIELMHEIRNTACCMPHP